MFKVALKLAYLGTGFYGFQRQPELRTVEGELIKALEDAGVVNNLEQSNYSIAGRTDRGVHSLGNVVTFRTDKKFNINHINDFLPKDIRILGSSSIPFGFNPRFAHRRHYRHVIYRDQWEEEWDLDKMQEAALVMEGTHNFLNFSKRNERNPIRRVDRVRITQRNRHYLVDVVGESFLWNMVRKMVSVLLSTGKSEINAKDVKNLLDPKYKAAIAPISPEGLILMEVCYQGVKFQEDAYARERFIMTLMEECRIHQQMLVTGEEMIRALNVY
jgi:tRNA pseudouridine38-40 synthase